MMTETRHEIAYYPTNQMNPYTGYGKMEIGLFRAFSQNGVRTAFDRREIALLVGRPTWIDHYPNLHGRRLWLYTMSESTRVSAEWVESINRHYERVLVPAPDLVPIYRNSGVEVDVHFVPLGVDYPAIRWQPREHKPKPFVWLTYSLGDMRKGAELVMFSFLRLFQGNPAHKLIIKCRDNPRWLAGLEDDQMTMVQGQQTEAEWQALLRSAHAFVFPSRGEGYGLPPREAVLAGLPTITTKWLGLWDSPQWAYPVSIKELRPSQFSFEEANAKDSQWGEPDIDLLDYQMLHVHRYYSAALDHTRRGREYLLKTHTWANTANQIHELLDAYA